MLNPLNLISKIFKSSNQKELDKLANFVTKINTHEEQTSKYDSGEFPKKTAEYNFFFRVREHANTMCVLSQN